MKQIVITIEGGLVREVLAPDVIVGVRDYDTEGCEPHELLTDDQGDTYTVYEV